MLISVVCIRHSVYVQQVVHFDFDVAHCSQAMKFMKLGSRPNTFLHCDINKLLQICDLYRGNVAETLYKDLCLEGLVLFGFLLLFAGISLFSFG
ncbi:hypothetical protein P8452_57643 [Trifolium repens]|nr:hypothetical protein P8452_57643 [Trifolium repens]